MVNGPTFEFEGIEYEGAVVAEQGQVGPEFEWTPHLSLNCAHKGERARNQPAKGTLSAWLTDDKAARLSMY